MNLLANLDIAPNSTIVCPLQDDLSRLGVDVNIVNNLGADLAAERQKVWNLTKQRNEMSAELCYLKDPRQVHTRHLHALVT